MPEKLFWSKYWRTLAEKCSHSDKKAGIAANIFDKYFWVSAEPPPNAEKS
jgi:hypothetical protein